MGENSKQSEKEKVGPETKHHVENIQNLSRTIINTLNYGGYQVKNVHERMQNPSRQTETFKKARK